MSYLPPHPGTEDEPGPGSPDQAPEKRPWAGILVVAIVMLLVAGMVVLHLAGVVGPGSH